MQLAQVASDRLLQDIQLCDENLGFWQSQLSTGSNANLLRLGLGPGRFVTDLATLLHLLPAAHHHARAQQLQQRVLLLKALRPLIAEAIAKVHGAAGVVSASLTCEWYAVARSRRAGVLEAPDAAAPVSGPRNRAQPGSAADPRTLQDSITHLSSILCTGGLGLPLTAQPSTTSPPSSSPTPAAVSHTVARNQLVAETPARAAPGTATATEQAEPGTAPGATTPPSRHTAVSCPRAAGGVYGASASAASATEQAEPGTAPGATTTAGRQTAVSRPRAAGGVSGASASAAVAQARRVASAAGPMLVLPSWVLMPSYLQRNWVAAACGAGAMAYSAQFVYRHSSWGGSNDFDRWGQAVRQSLQSSWRQHIMDPLLMVKEELFHTFRQRPGHASPEEYAASRASLLRMLEDFEADCPPQRKASSIRPDAVALHLAVAHADSNTSGIGTSSGSGIGGGGGGGGNGGHPSHDSSRMSKPLDLSNAPTSFAHSMLPPGTRRPRAQRRRPARRRGSPPAPAPTALQPQPARVAALQQQQQQQQQPQQQQPLQAQSGGGDALASGMAVMMAAYEEELKHPIRNLVGGQLARALLIQVQRLKVDTEAAMLELDQILKANELSISLVAAVPALALTWAVLSATVRWLIPRAPDVQREAAPLRMAMVELERSLLAAASAPEPDKLQADGLVIVELNRGNQGCNPAQVFTEAVRLYSQHDRTSSRSEWPPLYQDLLDLARPNAPAPRLKQHERIMRRYQVFKL
ncbi:MAG: hypothetical protein WDW36_005278 [Sanguina aurantia]